MIEPDDPIPHYLYAHDLERAGCYADAITHFEHAIALDPECLDAEVYGSTAWLLATCPDTSLRNGDRAVAYAMKACEDTEWEPWPLTILAAAYAEVGRFDDAIEAQQRAIELYRDYTHLEAEYRQKCQDRLACFKSKRSLDYDPEP